MANADTPSGKQPRKWAPRPPLASLAAPENSRSVPAIANRLIRARLALGVTATEICRRSGIAKNTYSQWEGGIGRPELDQAIKLVDGMGYTLDWIYLGTASTLPHGLAVEIAELQRQIDDAITAAMQRRPDPKAPE